MINFQTTCSFSNYSTFRYMEFMGVGDKEIDLHDEKLLNFFKNTCNLFKNMKNVEFVHYNLSYLFDEDKTIIHGSIIINLIKLDDTIDNYMKGNWDGKSFSINI